MAFKFAICFSLLLVHLSLVISEPLDFFGLATPRSSTTRSDSFAARRAERSPSQRRSEGGSSYAPRVNTFRSLATVTDGIADETDRVYQDQFRPAVDHYSNLFGQTIVEPAAGFLAPTGLGGLLTGGHRLTTKVLGDLYDNAHEAGQLGMRTTADVLDAGANYQDRFQDRAEQMFGSALHQTQGFAGNAKDFVGSAQKHAANGLNQADKAGKQMGNMAQGGVDAAKKELEEAEKKAKAALEKK